MKKLISFGLVVMGLMLLSAKSEAAGSDRGAKGYATVNYTATVSSISLPSSSVQTMPAVVYSVIMSTGATGDFVALFDTNTVTGITAALKTSDIFITRCMAGSTITTTMCNYDPPLQFSKGIAAINSAATIQATIVWEKGRVTQGY